jgi:hypothetical protein
LSTPGSSKGQEDLINAYEAEEERIINVLSRKLEQVRHHISSPAHMVEDWSEVLPITLQLHEEKISLENALEAESEFHVNRLSRELSALKATQQQQNGSPSATTNGNGHAATPSFSDPDVATMLETLQRENEQLRARLIDTERDYIRITRLNEIYRQELITHRNRVGIQPMPAS